MQGERGADHCGIIERHARPDERASTPAVREPHPLVAVDVAHRGDDEIISPRGESNPFRLSEERGRIDQRSDHQPVPIGHDFVVEIGTDASLARIEKRFSRGRKTRLLLRRRARGVKTIQYCDRPEMIARPIAGWGGAIELAEEGRVLRAKNPRKLVPGPNVEFAFRSLAIGVEACAKGSFLMRHFAPKPCDGLFGARPEQLVARFGVTQREKLENLGVVVKHFLEVRDEPTLVRRISGVAAAQMIINATFGHPRQRQPDEFPIGRAP
jgi:hypothetical protein